MATAPTCIIAYLGEADRYRPVRKAALEAARSAHARLILYDADAASRFGEPLPTWWSGEGADQMFSKRLAPHELEAAGRHRVAQYVRDARLHGLDAYGWLPHSRGAEELARYADSQEADMLVLPSDLENVGLLGKIKGQSSVAEIASQAERPIVIVDPEDAGERQG
jgi:nucleotide-binding universal stress UspA family protein